MTDISYPRCLVIIFTHQLYQLFIHLMTISCLSTAIYDMTQTRSIGPNDQRQEKSGWGILTMQMKSPREPVSSVCDMVRSWRSLERQEEQKSLTGMVAAKGDR